MKYEFTSERIGAGAFFLLRKEDCHSTSWRSFGKGRGDHIDFSICQAFEK